MSHISMYKKEIDCNNNNLSIKIDPVPTHENSVTNNSSSCCLSFHTVVSDSPIVKVKPNNAVHHTSLLSSYPSYYFTALKDSFDIDSYTCSTCKVGSMEIQAPEAINEVKNLEQLVEILSCSSGHDGFKNVTKRGSKISLDTFYNDSNLTEEFVQRVIVFLLTRFGYLTRSESMHGRLKPKVGGFQDGAYFQEMGGLPSNVDITLDYLHAKILKVFFPNKKDAQKYYDYTVLVCPELKPKKVRTALSYFTYFCTTVSRAIQRTPHNCPGSLVDDAKRSIRDTVEHLISIEVLKKKKEKIEAELADEPELTLYEEEEEEEFGEVNNNSTTGNGSSRMNLSLSSISSGSGSGHNQTYSQELSTTQITMMQANSRSRSSSFYK